MVMVMMMMMLFMVMVSMMGNDDVDNDEIKGRFFPGLVKETYFDDDDDDDDEDISKRFRSQICERNLL